MLRKEKENWVTGFKEKVGKYNTVILVSPSRVSVSDYEKAKRSVPSGVKIQVVKNRLAKIAFENTEFEAISSGLVGQTALILGQDFVDTCKGVKKFFDDNKDKIKIVAAVHDGKCYASNEVMEIAGMPSLEELQAKILSAINGVAVKMLRTINEVPSRVVRIISKLEKKEK